MVCNMHFYIMAEICIRGSTKDIEFMIEHCGEFRSLFRRTKDETHYTFIFPVPEKPGLFSMKMEDNGCNEGLVKGYIDACVQGAKWIKITLIEWRRV
jgi:hypothetical protein